MVFKSYSPILLISQYEIDQSHYFILKDEYNNIRLSIKITLIRVSLVHVKLGYLTHL